MSDKPSNHEPGDELLSAYLDGEINADERAAVEADGVVPVAIDLETASLDEIPDELDYVIHMAVSKEKEFDRALTANAEGVAFLMEKVAGPNLKAFFHCSSSQR